MADGHARSRRGGRRKSSGVTTVEAERKCLVQGRIGGSDHNSKDSRRAAAPKGRVNRDDEQDCKDQHKSESTDKHEVEIAWA